ncbi:hypothetical protein M5D96_013307, partial [Drosophila gunungcola]
DKAGNQDFNDEQKPFIAYNSELQLPEKKNGSIGIDQQAAEVGFFGLRLNCKEVHNIVSRHLDALAEKFEKAVENSGKSNFVNRKRVSLLDNSNGTDMVMRRENVESSMKVSRRSLNPDLDQSKALINVGKRQQLILNRAERAKTKGSGWFHLPATEVTEKMRNDLKIIQMRSVLNPRQFYKKNDLKILPKYFQVGTVTQTVSNTFKEQKATKTKSIVDELLEDESFQKFNKKKYSEVIQRKDEYKSYKKKKGN